MCVGVCMTLNAAAFPMLQSSVLDKAHTHTLTHAVLFDFRDQSL